MTCKNCAATFEGKYCSNCGQSANIHRITFKHLVHEFFHAFTHTDKGFILLAKALIARPGHVALDYLDGKRKRYFNPLSFLVITTAIYAFTTYHTGYFKALSGPPPQRPQAQSQMRERPSEAALVFFKAMGKANQIVAGYNGKILGLFLIYPLLAFFTWLFFIRNKQNFAEILVLSSFIVGEMYLFMIVVIIPAFLIAPSTVSEGNWTFHGISTIYMGIAYQQFFKNHIVLTILKTALIKILYVIFFWVVILLYVLAQTAITG